MANDELEVYEVPDFDTLEIDFLDNRDLPSIEEGIKKIQATNDLLGLVQGVALVLVEREELWRQAGFERLSDYRAAEMERLDMPKQTISDRRRIGEGYLDNKALIGKMKLTGHVLKLGLLSDAIRVHGDKKEVLSHFKTDSFRAFRDWIKPRLVTNGDLPDVDVRVEDGEILLDDTPLLAFDEDLEAEERDFIARNLKELYRARRGNCIPHITAVYSDSEGRWLDKALRDHRAQK